MYNLVMNFLGSAIRFFMTGNRSSYKYQKRCNSISYKSYHKLVSILFSKINDQFLPLTRQEVKKSLKALMT